MEPITFIKAGDEEKRVVLDAMGYEVNGDGLVCAKETGAPVTCPITNKEVRLHDASILPGSTIIINTSMMNLSEYLSRFVEEC